MTVSNKILKNMDLAGEAVSNLLEIIFNYCFFVALWRGLRYSIIDNIGGVCAKTDTALSIIHTRKVKKWKTIPSMH